MNAHSVFGDRHLTAVPPYDQNFSGRYFEGIDRDTFGSLGDRLVPCGIYGTPIAVDTARRFWWWDSEKECWGLVPNDDDCTRIQRELDEWLRIAPKAVKAMADHLMSPPHSGASHWDKFITIQETLLSAWGFEHPESGRAWLYRALTLDGRWMLTNLQIPVFDLHIFVILLNDSFGWPLSENTKYLLRLNPVTAAMTILFNDHIDVSAVRRPSQFRIIPGGLS